jgi:4-hydroxybenzoate polyprenyltransferase
MGTATTGTTGNPTHPGVRRADPVALLRAAHFPPTVAVTVVVALLAVADGKPPGVVKVVTAAVFTGQLTIGWGNDLVDAGRDRRVGRRDKPLASGRLSEGAVRVALAVAAVACVALSFGAGWRSAVVHLLLGVACGHAYNLLAKSTVWSWLPYAVAFGALPAVATLAGGAPHWPPWWMAVTAAVLGVGAHFLNVLPDLEDDRVTGIRGLPHRLGATRARATATMMLVLGSAVAVLGPAGAPPAWTLAILGVVVALAVVALVARGRLPFYAAIVIALLDVSLLTVVGT